MKSLLLFVLAAAPMLAQTAVRPAVVRYELSFANAAHHEAEVALTVPDVKRPSLDIVISRSSPGRYSLHEFAKNVYYLRAADANGRELKVARTTPYQYTVETAGASTVVVRYTVFGDRADGTFNGIDPSHAHLNMPATLAWARGYERYPVAVKFQIPEGSNWQVATQLVKQADGTYTAPNLDMLMDAPTELGPVLTPAWSVGDARFRLALHSTATPAEAEAFAKLCSLITAEAEGVWGAFPRYASGVYTFLIDAMPYSSGDGMEHRDSTVISGRADLKTGQVRALGTVSHEFFHSWNVERVRPRSIEPFDFERANMSGELWFAEGFTNYYGPLMIHRAGLDTLDDFARQMGGNLDYVINAPGNKVFNVIGMSQQATLVDGGNAVDPTNLQNNFISYYSYGEALALGIDLSIRTTFPGKSLDDWMRAMWRAHPDIEKPYTLDDLEKTLAGVTSREFARNIFARHVYGMESMPYAELLARAGLVLKKSKPGEPWIGGWGISFGETGAEIKQLVSRSSPLYAAGVDNGDRITEFDGKRIKSQGDFDTWLKTHKPGDRVALKIESRGGVERTATLTIGESASVELVTFEKEGRAVTDEIKALRAAWLGSKAIHPQTKPDKHCHECKRVYGFDYSYCPIDGKPLSFAPGSAADAKPTASDAPRRRQR